ncbi:MAG: protein of unknown function DUF323, partial [uncultured Solirubrobacteraceae bacterium]
VPAGLGSRPHRRLRGPLDRPPGRRAGAAASGACGDVRRLRDAASGSRGAPPARHRGRSHLPRRRPPPLRGVARRPAHRCASRSRGARPAPRAPAHRDDAPGHGVRRPAAAGRAAVQRRVERSHPRRAVGRGVARSGRGGGRGRRLRLRQRAPTACARPALLRHRPPARHQRDVAALCGGWWLRPPRVVERRGLGVEGGVRHHPPPRRGRDARRGARLPRLLVRGRRLRTLVRSPPPHRARVGEGVDLGSARRGRTCLGMDLLALHGLPRLHRLPVPRVLRGLLRPGLPCSARGLLGDASACRLHHVPQLGPTAAPADLRRRSPRPRLEEPSAL